MKIYCPEACQNHSNGLSHPESPARLERLAQMLNTDYAAHLEPSPAARQLADLPAIHEQAYITELCGLLDRLAEDSNKHTAHQIDSDTALSRGSRSSIEQCFGVIAQACGVLQHKETNHVFAATRPPGHHAEYDKAMGFCFINWAFLAAYLLSPEHKSKVAIIDFDVHHGNGTDDLTRRHCAQGYENIAYISLHEHPLFPGSGAEIPESDFPQNILNIPYPPYTDGRVFHNKWDELVQPFLHDFAPQFLIISAGFDAHHDDPLSTAQLDEEDFHRIGRSLADLNRPALSILEGGYNLDALENSVATYLDAWLDM